MQSLEFNTRNHDLKTVAGGRSLLRPLYTDDTETVTNLRRPVDRSRFFTNYTELVSAVNNLEVLLVERDQSADIRGSVKAPSSLLKPGDVLRSADIKRLIETDQPAGARLETMVGLVRHRRTRLAQTEDWWERFSDRNYFTENIFETDPTEQIVIGQDQIEPVTIYNFGEKLRKSHLVGLIGAVSVMSTFTDGYSRAHTPYIVVHDAFKPHHFARSGQTERAAGRAWAGEPFIEARRSALSTGPKGSMGQPWTAQLVAHELSHQIDNAVSSNYADFNSYFHYVDEDGDGLVDYVKPTTDFARAYSERELSLSEPVRDYGYTNGAEDLATVAEEVPFGGRVDRLREDAYREIVEAFKDISRKKYGEMQPLPDILKVEISRGGEVKLPLAPSLARPIQIRVDEANDSIARGFLRKILGVNNT